MSRVLLILLAGLALASAAAPERTQQRLCSLAVLPPGSISLGLSTTQITQPERFLSKAELQRRIKRLQAELAAEPNKVESQLELALYLQATDQDNLAHELLVKAVKLLRVQAADRPANARVQVRLAKALAETDGAEEAERILRKTTEKSPEAWIAWLALAEFLSQKSLRTVCGSTNRANEPLEKQIQALLPRRPSPAQLEVAVNLEKEADKCFARAEALAAEEPQIHSSHAVWGLIPAVLRPLLLAATSKTSEEKMESKAVMEKFASPEACARWEKAARLDPTNYIVIAYWGWLEAVPALMKAEAPLVALTGGRRARLVEAMSMLERLGDHPNAQLAAGSLETLGILRFVSGLRGPEARTAFRRAVTLDPERIQAWQGLIAFNFAAKNYEELVSICEERLKHEESAQNHIDAAKACLRAGLVDKAMGHGEAALKLADDDPAAQISVAALLLLRFGPDGDLAEVKKHLRRALELAKTVQDPERSDALAYANGVNLAIALSLAGDAETARKILEDVDRIDSLSEDQHTRVSEVRIAIGK